MGAVRRNQLQIHDTIVAISTPPGRSGVGVVRLSGSEARRIAGIILRFRAGHEWTPWTVALAELIDDSGAAVDQVVVAYFAAPRSYTAEDLVEISCHGSPVILRFCVDRACTAGARLAEPGEFTLRAYLNGRIDLPQAEAVAPVRRSSSMQGGNLENVLFGLILPATEDIREVQ